MVDWFTPSATLLPWSRARWLMAQSSLGIVCQTRVALACGWHFFGGTAITTEARAMQCTFGKSKVIPFHRAIWLGRSSLLMLGLSAPGRAVRPIWRA